MKLLETFIAYAETDENAERAIFEAAMEKTIKTTGYRLSDLMFEVFKCRRDLAMAVIEINKNTVEINHLKAKLNKKKAA